TESRNIVAAICAQVPLEAPLVIGGDFNFSLGERLPSESIRTTKQKEVILQDFRANGFLIAWRDSHPGEPLPQTLRWTRQPTTPYHCDGFLTRGIPQSSIRCDIISEESVTCHSDHNPVILNVA